MLVENGASSLNDIERRRLALLVTSTLSEIIEKTIKSKTPKERARTQAGVRAQSVLANARPSLMHTVLTLDLKHPLLPRDFRPLLDERTSEIHRPDLSHILAQLVRLQIVERNDSYEVFPRGRPGKNSNIPKERRGSRQYYYEESQLKKTLSSLLKDDVFVDMIVMQLKQSGVLFRLFKYVNAVMLFEARTDEESVFITYLQRGLTRQRTDANAAVRQRRILIKDMSDEQIDRYAEEYAKLNMEKYLETKNQRDVLELIILMAGILGVIQKRF